MSTSAPSMPDISLTFGPDYWGLVVSTLLLGVAVVQGYIYYANNSDGWFMHIYVFVMLALDVATTALIAEALYYYLITNAGNPNALNTIRSTFYAEIFLSVINIFLSQQFYASRIYAAGTRRLGRLAAAIVSILSVFSLGDILVGLYQLHAAGLEFSSFTQPRWKIFATSAIYVDTFCDALATI
ncbi:uncharacterized protein FOMMEDRAFT_169838, partial [Fomitiporia mediterranea MF3/22]|uniref:uncharacterized protein n=1 Tax=Fomitiporia mediterranea (strain MF3/22) TaxID=694068 RepID=UPI000440883B